MTASKSEFTFSSAFFQTAIFADSAASNIADGVVRGVLSTNSLRPLSTPFIEFVLSVILEICSENFESVFVMLERLVLQFVSFFCASDNASLSIEDFTLEAFPDTSPLIASAGISAA